MKREEHSPIVGVDGDVCSLRFLRKVDVDLPRDWFLRKVDAALPQG